MQHVFPFSPCSSHLRACLKEQLAQVEPPHKQFVKQVGESQAVAEQTRREEEREQQRQAKHRAFLSEFRDSNKQVRRSLDLLLE